MREVRVRFAPSPTGHLHVGGARTALFNWLFARKHKGKFILRIEDTDVARSSEEMTKGILEGMRWLGLSWDEGPYYQSKRIKVYQEYAERLIKEGKAYYCYCTPEEIQERKRKAVSNGKYWKYDRFCLSLTPKEKENLEKQKKAKAIRFFVPEGKTTFQDLIHGEIVFEHQNIEDFVLLRRDGLPTYHLSVVIDDLEFSITHVIRGDDHLSNTPKQILLYQALKALIPQFAHLALILGSDRKKLSKRHGVTSVLHFREEGYLPLAMFNFLAQLSWSPGEEKEVYSIEEMIEKFFLDQVSKANPIFDLAKLDWLNSRLISKMTASELTPYVKDILKRENLWREELEIEKKEWFLKLIDLLKDRCRTLKDFARDGRPYLTDDFSYDSQGAEKYLSDERLKELLPKLIQDLEKMDNFTTFEVEKVYRQRAEQEGVKAALFIHASRMAVTGKPVSPSLFAVLEIIGKEKTISRLKKLVDYLTLSSF
ncbi:MAG: glutamate--tRNA ligase [Candidatus Aminicenantia bacterium]